MDPDPYSTICEFARELVDMSPEEKEEWQKHEAFWDSGGYANECRCVACSKHRRLAIAIEVITKWEERKRRHG